MILDCNLKLKYFLIRAGTKKANHKNRKATLGQNRNRTKSKRPTWRKVVKFGMQSELHFNKLQIELMAKRGKSNKMHLMAMSGPKYKKQMLKIHKLFDVNMSKGHATTTCWQPA